MRSLRGSRADHQVTFFLRELVHTAAPRRLAAVKGLGSVRARWAWQDLSVVARSDEDPGVRAAAIRSLGRLSVEDATGVLIVGLFDNEPQVRVAAARALKAADAGGGEVVAALTAALADTEWKVREVAAAQLGRIGVATVAVLDALVGALSVREDWRTGMAWWQARRALDTLAGEPATAAVTVDGLRRGLRSAPAGPARYGCLVLLGSRAPGDVRGLALPVLADPYQPTRRFAAYLLIERPHPDNLEPLTTALVAEGDVRTWWTLQQALAALLPAFGTDEMARLVADAHPGAAAAFARVAHPAVTTHARMLLGFARTRAAAAVHLGAFGSPIDADLLIPVLDDPDEVTRAAAVGALAQLFARVPANAARDRSLPTLVDLLTDRSWWVRHHAAQVLHTLAGLDGIDPPTAISAGWALVRTVAAEPLAALTAPYTTDDRPRQIGAYLLIWRPHLDNLAPLTAALANEQRTATRRLIFAALRRLHTVVDVEAVLPLLAAGHPGAAAALAELDHPEVATQLRSLLTDPVTRAAAAVHLGRFGTPHDTALLTALLDDADELVRIEAKLALARLSHAPIRQT